MILILLFHIQKLTVSKFAWMMFLLALTNGWKPINSLNFDKINFLKFYQHCPDDWGSKHLWNVSQLQPDCMVQYPSRQSSSYF
jgi:hypothetical protein